MLRSEVMGPLEIHFLALELRIFGKMQLPNLE